jgi:hypothetical protein
MKTASTLLMFLFALSAPVARADYVIAYMFEAFGQGNDFIIKVKDTRSRIDYADGSILSDSATEYMTVLNHTSRTYMKLNGDSLLNFFKTTIVGGLGKSKSADFVPTGNSEKISGYETQEFIATSAGVQMRLFLAKDDSTEQKLATAIKKIYNSPALDAMRGFAALADQRSGIPVRIVYELQGLQITMTLKSVVETNLDDREFAVPANYREES